MLSRCGFLIIKPLDELIQMRLEMKKIPHPIQYQGSKRNLAQAILNYFPDSVNNLIEPFAGSAAISIAAAKNNLANLYVINDLNKPLVKLLHSIVEVPDKTALAYEEIWHEQGALSQSFDFHS